MVAYDVLTGLVVGRYGSVKEAEAATGVEGIKQSCDKRYIPRRAWIAFRYSGQAFGLEDYPMSTRPLLVSDGNKVLAFRTIKNASEALRIKRGILQDAVTKGTPVRFRGREFVVRRPTRPTPALKGAIKWEEIY